MPDDVTALFEEFARRYADGERPDVREYLERAGKAADELAPILEAFLQRAPAPEPDEVTLDAVGAWLAGEAPLVHLRARRGVRRDQVVAAVMKAVGLGPRAREQVAYRYHQLENGFLSPARVDRRVLEAIAQTLRVKVEELLAWPARPFEAEAAYLRPSDQAAPAAAAPARTFASRKPRAVGETEEEEAGDEVDRLFGVQPGA